MPDLDDDFIVDHTAGLEVTQKSTVENGVHIPHVKAEVTELHPQNRSYSDHIIGGADGTTAALTASGQILAAPADFTKYNVAAATLILIVSSVASSPSISIDMGLSEDGENELGDVEDLFSGITANGTYVLKLDDSSFIYSHFPFFKVKEGNGGTANVRLVLVARGGG